MMQLSELLLPWCELNQVVEISSMTLDSRKVTTGCLFVAIQGHAVDGRQFIPVAIKQGASAVLAQSDEINKTGTIGFIDQTPIIYLDALSIKLSAVAGRFYHAEQRKMQLVGITGTNGKTTISQIIAQWATLLGKPAGVMGTTGNGLLTDLKPALNTTGNPIEIQQTLSDLENIGAKLTALEISSHGLVQSRVNALNFDAAVFTNLSRDHLDYHGDMESYAKAKKLLFTTHNPTKSIINADDSVGVSWLKELPSAIGVSLNEKQLSFHSGKKVFATSVIYSTDGIQISLNSDWGSANLSVPLIGAFNASNILVAFATLLSLGYDILELEVAAPKLSAVIGRMELFSSEGKAKIVVDYAHTPDALDKALQALRVHCSGKLWCIFGCGGDRDTGKRPMMARIAEQQADVIILSDDNPRSEDPGIITKDMLVGLNEPEAAKIIHDRFDACQYALSQAGENDIILLAGKGHEDYQVLANKTVHYSDRESAQKLLGLLS
ncbi:UDP-N-acetylmuramoyl-L-alanyl-D-glutamate--2,6-diaminopimelate ligase [Aliivibrio sp. 1S165]|uniref:UDP-N-acetylmuramoyl-L-alanyl-D-glutamate--2, 6-diaminopimelate ligase n=1 Tax=unclassified Aliivibrio TaxID=2645654 RepID=UPI00080ED4CB|nr:MULTISPECIES: UDP-N-acetylmuramoyl-L-alanyl-D-glutamate--2,6-diaminopimelate ligase [unclassified Aliivibrio]OCH18496.1 UDP-N-acetylmuramoyl-L-alanyl-D-glutamate--2,6-diaminopimelate ligase [Aliivibrio sp. 1S165]OCH34931.1 UDP-N-acetylmuramoyl-L-alanyl-D-glutamate--2,6-diaminopimelate ligase [Aliivibrio sp. 1S175]